MNGNHSVELKEPRWPNFILIDGMKDASIPVGDLSDETIEWLASRFVDHCKRKRVERRREGAAHE